MVGPMPGALACPSPQGKRLLCSLAPRNTPPNPNLRQCYNMDWDEEVSRKQRALKIHSFAEASLLFAVWEVKTPFLHLPGYDYLYPGTVHPLMLQENF